MSHVNSCGWKEPGLCFNPSLLSPNASLSLRVLTEKTAHRSFIWVFISQSEFKVTFLFIPPNIYKTLFTNAGKCAFGHPMKQTTRVLTCSHHQVFVFFGHLILLLFLTDSENSYTLSCGVPVQPGKPPQKRNVTTALPACAGTVNIMGHSRCRWLMGFLCSLHMYWLYNILFLICFVSTWEIVFTQITH